MSTDLRISPDGRGLAKSDRAPFFYLADTAWDALSRLNREEMDLYLADRAAKRFTVVQTVALSVTSAPASPNAYGEPPLRDLDPTRPNDAYYQHVDYFLDRAAALGLYVGLLPVWGSYVAREMRPPFASQQFLNADSAYAYARYLGERYRQRTNLIWILGGDRTPEGFVDVWRAIARGIAEGVAGAEDYRAALMTYHPLGGTSSGQWLHHEPWLAVNMLQSGHARDHRTYEMVAADYRRTPPKPVINGEPGYEGIPDGLLVGQPKLDDWDARRFAYWSVFAGACGHTYGANEVWQMWAPGREPLYAADTPWHEALHYPGAGQMQHLRALIESRPMLGRVPDQSLLLASAERDTPGPWQRHAQATRAADGSYAFVYIPSGDSITVDLGALSGREAMASWYDPRHGVAQPICPLPTGHRHVFMPPSQGPGQDWVLVLDDAARGFPPPPNAP